MTKLKLMTFQYDTSADLVYAERWSLTTRDHQVYMLVTRIYDNSWDFHILQVKDGVASFVNSEIQFCESPFGGPRVAMAPAGNFMAWESGEEGFKAHNFLTGETHCVQIPSLEEKDTSFEIDDIHSYIVHMTADNDFLYTTTIHMISGYDEIHSLVLNFSMYNWVTKTYTVVSKEIHEFPGLHRLNVAYKDGYMSVHDMESHIFSTKLQHSMAPELICYKYDCTERHSHIHNLHFQNQDAFVFCKTKILDGYSELNGIVELQRM